MSWGGVQDSEAEAETRDPPVMMPMETGRPAANPQHRWWAEVELRDWHNAAAKGQKMAQDTWGDVGEGGWEGVQDIREVLGCVCCPHTPNHGLQYRERGEQGNDLRGHDRTNRQFRADKQFKTNLHGRDGINRQFQAGKQFKTDLHGRFRTDREFRQWQKKTGYIRIKVH